VCHTVSAGFSHSAAVSNSGKLYVWGDNENKRLWDLPGAPKNGILEKPENVVLRDGGQFDPTPKKGAGGGYEEFEANEYRAVDVACGPAFVAVVARKDEKAEVEYDDNETKPIAKRLEEELRGVGDLLDCFRLHEDPEFRERLTQKASRRKGSKARRRTGWKGAAALAGAVADADVEAVAAAEARKKLQSMDRYSIPVQESDFATALKRWSIKEAVIKRMYQQIVMHCSEKNKYRSDTNFDKSSKANVGKTISMGDVEDYALGFKQHNNKVFVFGSCPRAVRAFAFEADTEKIANCLGDRRQAREDAYPELAG
jgi:phosphopantetheinyl transferase (holo-ACP synthase)